MMRAGPPIVSVVTPSYNKVAFIEETILSIRNQTYPHIEHIVVDGGSTDGTLDILRRYEDKLKWISEPDKGQSDAINKGWRMAKGQILAYLNADDTYMPWAVESAVRCLSDNPDAGMIYGQCSIIDQHGQVTGQYTREDFNMKRLLCCSCFIAQPTVFIRREVLNEVGYLDTNLYMAMDLDFWIRIALKYRVKYLTRLLANYRFCPGTKTADELYRNEADHLHILEKLFANPSLPTDLRRIKRAAYANVYLMAGIHKHTVRDMKSARKHLITALRFQPQLILTNRWLSGYLITTFLGSRATDLLVGWIRRFYPPR